MTPNKAECAWVIHRPQFFDTTAVAFGTTQKSGLEQTPCYLEPTALKWGCAVVARAGVEHVPFGYDPSDRAKQTRKRRALATRFCKVMEADDRPAPSLYELSYFLLMRLVINAADDSPADAEYWQERRWLEAGRRCFLETPPEYGSRPSTPSH